MRLVLLTGLLTFCACAASKFSGEAKKGNDASSGPQNPAIGVPTPIPVAPQSPANAGISTVAENSDIDVPIEFQHLPDTAHWTNCLKISVNGGPEVDLGCNRGDPLKTASVTAKSKPFCNQVRLNLYSNGKFNKSTQNSADVQASFRIQRTAPGQFTVQCNDNSDNDYNDLNLSMTSKSPSITYTVENSGIACD